MKVRVFRLGLDWITYFFDESYADEFLEGLFAGFSETANQRFGVPFFGCEFDITYLKTEMKRILVFYYLGTSVFELVKHQQTIKIKLGYKFTFYGAYFYIDDLSQILQAFTKLYQEHMHISRMDIALDCDVPVPVFYKRNRTQFHAEIDYKLYGVVSGFYLGSRKGNRKHFIRVYDKKIDSDKKEKFHLFLPYFGEEVVTRVEVEMHVLTLKTLGIIPQTIIDYEEARCTDFTITPNCLEQYFASLCMKKSGTFLYPLKNVHFKDVERLNTATFTGKVDDEILDKVRYVNIFVGMGRRLKKMGFDPYQILQRHGLL